MTTLIISILLTVHVSSLPMTQPDISWPHVSNSPPTYQTPQTIPPSVLASSSSTLDRGRYHENNETDYAYALLRIDLDEFSGDTGWRIVSENATIIKEVLPGTYLSGITSVEQTLHLTYGDHYTLILMDKYGDGMKGQVYLYLGINEDRSKVLASFNGYGAGEFSQTDFNFHVSEMGFLQETLVVMELDQYPSETGFRLQTFEGGVVYEALPGTFTVPDTKVKFSFFLDHRQLYTFTISDTFGDGKKTPTLIYLGYKEDSTMLLANDEGGRFDLERSYTFIPSLEEVHHSQYLQTENMLPVTFVIQIGLDDLRPEGVRWELYQLSEHRFTREVPQIQTVLESGNNRYVNVGIYRTRLNLTEGLLYALCISNADFGSLSGYALHSGVEETTTTIFSGTSNDFVRSFLANRSPPQICHKFVAEKEDGIMRTPNSESQYVENNITVEIQFGLYPHVFDWYITQGGEGVDSAETVIAYGPKDELHGVNGGYSPVLAGETILEHVGITEGGSQNLVLFWRCFISEQQVGFDGAIKVWLNYGGNDSRSILLASSNNEESTINPMTGKLVFRIDAASVSPSVSPSTSPSTPYVTGMPTTTSLGSHHGPQNSATLLLLLAIFVLQRFC